MLTYKQLEDAVRCCLEFDCWKCANALLCDKPGGATQEAAKTALAYRAMLKRLEFSNLTWDGAECYICGGRGEHEKGCELAALLKESECEEG